MSFFKKIQDRLEDALGDDKKKESSYPSATAQDSIKHGGGVPPPLQGASPPGPQLPPGWISQWDHASQRFYFLEQATGRTQWEPPTFQGPASGLSAGQSSGYYEHSSNNFKEDKDGQEKKKENKSGMWKGAAGGLAVGAVGGAVVGHALGDDSSDEEHKSHAPSYPPGYGAEPSYYPHETAYAAAPLPVEDHHSVSSSDREDLREAREEYENASSSDKESAREEYEEQYEETYGSD